MTVVLDVGQTVDGQPSANPLVPVLLVHVDHWFGFPIRPLQPCCVVVDVEQVTDGPVVGSGHRIGACVHPRVHGGRQPWERAVFAVGRLEHHQAVPAQGVPTVAATRAARRDLQFKRLASARISRWYQGKSVGQGRGAARQRFQFRNGEQRAGVSDRVVNVFVQLFTVAVPVQGLEFHHAVGSNAFDGVGTTQVNVQVERRIVHVLVVKGDWAVHPQAACVGQSYGMQLRL